MFPNIVKKYGIKFHITSEVSNQNHVTPFQVAYFKNAKLSRTL